MFESLLIVEDDADMCLIMKAFAEKMGISCVTASDGIQALSVLDREVPAAMVTDIMMPNMDGIELILAVKRRKLGIPILAVSVRHRPMENDLLAAAIEFGARNTLRKPFSEEEFRAALIRLKEGKPESPGL